MNRKIRKLMILMSMNIYWYMELSLGAEWHSDMITMGEISLEDYDGHLPTITLTHNDHVNSYDHWRKNAIQSCNKPSSLLLLNDTVDIPEEHHHKFISIDKEIGVTIEKEIPIKISHIVPEPLLQSYPVLVPVTKPVPYEIVEYIVKRKRKKKSRGKKYYPFKLGRYRSNIRKVPYKILKAIIRHSHG